MSEDKQKRTVQTTGHAWDGDIQEFNNPLPTWWLWGFYLTVVFAVIYWFLYPAWPVGEGYTKGVANEIEYVTAEGKTVKTHWNTRALYQQELQMARQKQAEYQQQLAGKSYKEILSDPGKREYAFSVANVLFADNCAACHQDGGAGLAGMYPNLVDDDWLWGGSFEQIQASISDGRNGSMPGFKKRLSEQQLDDVSEYVLSLSEQHRHPAMAKRGESIFNGDGGCFACHTKAATGNPAMGAANLTDKIWTVAVVDPAMSYTEKKDAVKQVISNGIKRTMPAWKSRFNELEIRMLALYVHELGGGE